MRRIVTAVLASVFMASGIHTSAAAATAGSKCPVAGKTAKAGTTTLLCARNTKGVKVWVKLPVSPRPTSPSAPTFEATPVSSLLPAESCRLKTVDARPDWFGGISSGFPNLSALHGLTNIRALALFIDFPDREGTEITFEKDRIGLEEISSYFREQSYGKVQIEWSTSSRYARMPRPIASYNLNRALFQTRRDDNTPFLQNAITAADSFTDFSQFDLVVLMPPDTATYEEYGSFAGTRSGLAFKIYSQEGQVRNIQTLPAGRAHYGTSVLATRWGGLLHEIGHELGLVDYYNYAANQTTNLGTRDPFMHIYDPMGDLWTNTGSELTAWSRMQLGFLSEAEIRCTSKTSSTVHELQPLVLPGSSFKATFVRIDDHRLLALEHRVARAYDRQLTKPQQGLIAYLVDTSRNTGQGPLQLLFPDGSTDPKSPALTVGSTLTTDGITVKILASSDSRVRFSVSPTP